MCDGNEKHGKSERKFIFLFPLIIAILLFSVSQVAAACPDGMVGYWEAEGNMQDSYNSHNGSIIGHTTYATGRLGYGQAFDFDGSDGVRIPHSSDLNMPQSFTFAAWVYARTLGDEKTIFSKVQFGAWKANYLIRIQGSQFTDYCEYTSSNYQEPSFFPMPQNEWVHIAVVADRSTNTFRGYKNGQLISTVPRVNSDFGVTNNDLYIGNRFDTKPFNGLIDEVALFNRALNNTEIQEIYDRSNANQSYCERSAAPPEPICTAGQTQSCYTGPTGTEGVGICTAGTQECSQDGMSWGACTGDVVPQIEICNNLDDDCDGTPDNVADADKPDCSKHLGVCAGAKQVCTGDGWMDCSEEDYQAHSSDYSIVESSNVTCWDGVDNNCNGPWDANEPFCQPTGGVVCNACDSATMLDVNNDGVVNINDAIIILRHILMFPNQVVGQKPCGAISITSQ